MLAGLGLPAGLAPARAAGRAAPVLRTWPVAGSIRLRSRITGPWLLVVGPHQAAPPSSVGRLLVLDDLGLDDVVVLAAGLARPRSPACALAACDWA